MKTLYRSFITILFVSSFVLAQSPAPPKHEFRAVWVATVSNIDWPSSKSLSTTAQKNEVIAILDKHKQSNINAILLQVRPSCDAFYYSEKEPFSEWLVGVQGGNLSLWYDPLQFWIEEAHKRGMELHAWFNPYRSVVSSGSSVHSSHISKTHPEWNINYGASPYKFLDPGIPAVRDYVVDVIMDVVKRYDIDGVHFDDYFYPYGGMTNQDDATFASYPRGFTSRADWRRDNVNLFVRMVHDSIKAVKPWVKFGISPFGIWKSGTPSGVSGLSAYDQIYCDGVNWITNRIIDYITPQMYWVIAGGQDYSKLMPWWASYVKFFGRHLYSGNAAYRIDPNGSNWPASEIQNQIRLNRQPDRAQGAVFFSSKSITLNYKGIQDSLRNNEFRYRAFTPPMPWLDSVPPVAPANLVATVTTPTSVMLQWSPSVKAIDNDSVRRVLVYRASFPDTINTSDPRTIIYVSGGDTNRFVDGSVQLGQKYSYAVTTLDKMNNESSLSLITVTVTSVQDVAQVPFEYSLEQNYPNPFNPTTTIRFTLAQENFTTVKIYDLLGREIATMVEESLHAGPHAFEFSGANLSSGVYLYRIVSGEFVQSKKMVLQK